MRKKRVLEDLIKQGLPKDSFLKLETGFIHQKGSMSVLHQVELVTAISVDQIVILVGRGRRVEERKAQQSNESEYRPAFKRKGAIPEEMAQSTARF